MGKNLFFFTLCLIFVLGCATVHEIPPVSEIKDGIKIKLVDVTVKSKESQQNTHGAGQGRMTVSESSLVTKDTKVDNNLVYSNYIYDTSVSTPGGGSNKILKYYCVHGIYGILVKLDYKAEGPPMIGELELTSNRVASNITNQLSMTGKIVKTGDVIKSFVPPSFEKLFKHGSIPFEMEEVVRGLGSYNDKSVIVTELISAIQTMEDSFKVKGYVLYDPDTFIPLYKNLIIIGKIYVPYVGKQKLKIEYEYETIDMEIRNVIDIPPI